MHIEDLLISCYQLNVAPVGSWDQSFIKNVVLYLFNDKPLSTQQAKNAIRIISKYKNKLDMHHTARDIEYALLNPTYRHKLYQSLDIPRQVRYLGEKYLGFRYKKNDIITNQIKTIYNKQKYEKPKFNSQYRIWVVPVYREKIYKIKEIISEYRFSFDDDVVNYLTECLSIENTTPQVVMDENIMLYIPDNQNLAYYAKYVLGGK